MLRISGGADIMALITSTLQQYETPVKHISSNALQLKNYLIDNDPFYPKDYKIDRSSRDMYVHGNIDNSTPPIRLHCLQIYRITNRLIIFKHSREHNPLIIEFLNERYKSHYKIFDLGNLLM
jgi:hypothetical protein